MRRRISQPRLLLALALMLASLATGSAAPAHASGWVPATPPATAANGPGDPAVAVDPSGDAIAAWSDDDGAGTQSLLVAWRPAGGAWSAALPLASDAGIDAPAVAIDAAGDATVLWIESADGIAYAAKAARRDATGGAWSAPHDFAPIANGVADPQTQLRTDALGEVVAAWIEHDAGSGVAAVRAAVADASGAWSAPATLSEPASEWVIGGPPQIAPDAAGGPLVGWTALSVASPGDYAARTATWSLGAWQPPSDLVTTSGVAISPLRLAGVAGGGAAASWTQDDGVATTLWGALRTNGVWSVDPLSDDVATGCQPLQAIGADPADGATVAWKAASSDGLDTRRLTSGGPEARVPLFASPTGSAEEVALDRGLAVLVAHDAASGIDSVLASRRQDDGQWSAPAPVATGAADESLADLQLVRDDAGDALASWRRTDGATGAKTLAAAAFQAAGPVLSAVDVPADGTAGTPLALSASARSTFASVTQIAWDFGDGTPAVAGASVAHTYASAGTYSVTVTATDSVGGTAQATRQVVVAAAPASRPPGGGGGSSGGSGGGSGGTVARLLAPVLGVPRSDVLTLARGARTLKLVVRNPNGVRLTGSATLVRPRAGRRPALTLAIRRGVRFPAGRRTTLTLRLTAAALRALERAPAFRLPVKLVLHLRAADGGRASATRAATLDAAARFGIGRLRLPHARTSC